MASIDLSQFVHRTSYEVLTDGRDGYNVACLAKWLPQAVQMCIQEASCAGPVLDVGCGGQPLRGLVESLGQHYVGMDVCQSAKSNVEIIAAIDDPGLIPTVLKEGSYSLILCTEVMEHVPNWSTGFANLHKLLKPGGRIILTIPFFFPLHMEPFDYYRVTTHGMVNIARTYGFELEHQERLGDAFDVLCTLLSDISILPADRTLVSRVKNRLTQMAKNQLVRLLRSKLFKQGLTANSNLYLNNAVILRAIKTQ